MAQLVHVGLFAWILLVVVAFPRLAPHRAVIAAFVVGLLFLPFLDERAALGNRPAPLQLAGLHFTKQNVISYAILLAVLVHDRTRLLSFRPRWFDLPMLAWCLVPLASALTNAAPPDGSMQLKDGLSQALQQTWHWGVPYLLGRVYLTHPRTFRDLALGIVLGGLAYVPFCLYEIRMSPQLHVLVYGYAQHDFTQTIRFGGYRPMVFMQHGLAVGMWMTAATLVGFWLWWTGAVTHLALPGSKRPLSMAWLLLVLLVTTALSKSTGALVLGLAGLAVLFVTRSLRTRLALLCLLAVAPCYLAGRTSGAFTGQYLVEWAKRNIGDERAASLEFRLDNEDLLKERAFEQPVFGWGGWGRARVSNDEGKDISVTDGLWIITLGDRGWVGLVALYAAMLLPATRLLWPQARRAYYQPAFAPVIVLAVILVLYMIDNLLNNMFNPVFVFAAGGLAGWTGAGVPPPVATVPVSFGQETSARSPPVFSDPSARRPGVLRRPLPLRH